MPSRKALILFFVIVVVVYGALVAPWPGLMSGYRRAFSGLCEIFFGRLGDARLTFESMTAPTLDKDTHVTIKNVKTGVEARTTVNARRAYLPVAFTIALIVAAPIAWRRKLASLALGLVLIMCYAGFGVWLKLMNVLSEPRLGAVSLGPFLRSTMKVLIVVLTMSPVVPYIAALLIFILVTIRRDDLLRLSSASRKPSSVAPLRAKSA